MLASRFAAYEKVKDDATPRFATLRLQRAIYVVEFDRAAAALSLAQSRTLFDRTGGAQPQFKALLAYVDARIAGNAGAIRAAEDAVDRVYLSTDTRKGNTSWRVPHLSSLSSLSSL